MTHLALLHRKLIVAPDVIAYTESIKRAIEQPDKVCTHPSSTLFFPNISLLLSLDGAA